MEYSLATVSVHKKTGGTLSTFSLFESSYVGIEGKWEVYGCDSQCAQENWRYSKYV